MKDETRLIVRDKATAELADWQAMGLEPVEIATDDLEQRISISHNALTGQITWKTEKMDGVQALGILASAAASMFGYFFKAQPRPKLTSGQAQVAVALEGDRLTVGLQPLHDPMVVKGALLAALLEVMERSTAGGDPAKDWAELFEVELRTGSR